MVKKLNLDARCVKCNSTFREIFIVALMQEAGAKAGGWCPPSEHDFDGKLWVDETEVSTP